MGRKKRDVKTVKAKKASEKIEKAKKASEKIEKVDVPKEEITEDHQSTLPNKDLFRIDEVATYFSVTERTIRLWLDHGHLIAAKKAGTIRILRKSILDCHILDNRKTM